MIRDPAAWQEWEAEWQRRTPADPEANFRIFWTLLEMARAAGAWPPSPPLEGLEVDIRLAHAINYGRLHEPGRASHGDTENTEPSVSSCETFAKEAYAWPTNPKPTATSC